MTFQSYTIYRCNPQRQPLPSSSFRTHLVGKRHTSYCTKDNSRRGLRCFSTQQPLTTLTTYDFKKRERHLFFPCQVKTVELSVLLSVPSYRLYSLLRPSRTLYGLYPPGSPSITTVSSDLCIRNKDIHQSTSLRTRRLLISPLLHRLVRLT